MKNRVKNMVLVLLLSLCLVYVPAKADSGWDTDYDSGSSSWDSGGSFDFDSSYDSGSSGSSSIEGAIITLVIIVIIFIIIYVSNKNKVRQDFSNVVDKYKELSIDEIRKIDPDFNLGEFKNNAFNIYKDIQTAWMNFDREKIRELTTDEIYNMYCSQLDTLELKHQKNIMKDITLEDFRVTDIKKENDVITVTTNMKIKCYDYVIKDKTKEVVRGTSKQKVVILYELTFIKSASDTSSIVKCPNCGAKVDINSSATCPYCDSVLVKTSSKYVLSKKKNIKQYNDWR